MSVGFVPGSEKNVCIAEDLEGTLQCNKGFTLDGLTWAQSSVAITPPHHVQVTLEHSSCRSGAAGQHGHLLAPCVGFWIIPARMSQGGASISSKHAWMLRYIWRLFPSQTETLSDHLHFNDHSGHSGAVPLHCIRGSDAVVSSNHVEVSVHRHETGSAAGAAQGCYICAPAVRVWVVPATAVEEESVDLKSSEDKKAAQLELNDTGKNINWSSVFDACSREQKSMPCTFPCTGKALVKRDVRYFPETALRSPLKDWKAWVRMWG